MPPSSSDQTMKKLTPYVAPDKPKGFEGIDMIEEDFDFLGDEEE